MLIKFKLRFLQQPLQWVRLLCFIICLLTTAGFWGKLWWLFDLANHFRSYFLLLLLLSVAFFLFVKQYKESVLMTIFALINLLHFLPLYTSQPISNSNDPLVRAMLINVYEDRGDIEQVHQLIQQQQPHIVLLVETNLRWNAAMADLQNEYPYRMEEPRFAGAGLSLYSKYPLKNVRVWNIAPVERPAILAEIELEGQQLMFVGMHPHPPLNRQTWGWQTMQMDKVADFAKSQNRSMIVLGDLNTTPWSSTFKMFLERSGLENGRLGFGLAPTWPTNVPLLGIPLDHFLHSSDITVHNLVTGPDVGSDHHPIIIDFSFESPID